MVHSVGKDLGKELNPEFSDCTVCSVHGTLQCPEDRTDQSYVSSKSGWRCYSQPCIKELELLFVVLNHFWIIYQVLFRGKLQSHSEMCISVLTQNFILHLSRPIHF